MQNDYAEGIRIAQTIKDLDGPNVNPVCQSRLYTHGHRTERSLVLLHGFTNCPRQMDALGTQLFAQGWNVFIPRYPRHGYTNRLTDAIAELRSEHLVALANRSVEVGTALGERLTVAGLSLGAILAGLMAQRRADVDRAVLIAPMLGLRPIPGPMLTVLSLLATRAPNLYVWWSRKDKGRIGPSYGYPRFSTRAYAALFECGRMLVREARRAAPKAKSLVVVTNAAEPRLDNRFTYALIDSWRNRDADVETYEFPIAERLPHDLIDPSNPAQNIELVYPVVTRLISYSSLPGRTSS